MGLFFSKIIKKFFIITFCINSTLIFSQSNYEKFICNSINAKKVSVNKIKISWKNSSDPQTASIAIFRSTMPINSTSIISSLKPIADVPANTNSYTDSLEYYGDYYYALVPRNKNGDLFNTIFPSVNATVKSVSILPPDNYSESENINEEKYNPGELRNLPLPYLGFISDLNTSPTEFSPEAIKGARKLAGKYSKKEIKILPPYIFEKDEIRVNEGDDFFLFESLKNYFIKKDYKGSAQDLKNFLSITRDPYVTMRAVFYLAESHYYCKNYKKALELFLFVEEEFPELSKKWIDSILDLYQIPEN